MADLTVNSTPNIGANCIASAAGSAGNAGSRLGKSSADSSAASNAGSSATSRLSAAEEKKLREACQELESFLWQEVLRGLRRSVPENSLLPQAAGHDLFQDLLDEELAKAVSKGNRGGLADLLYRQLAGSFASAPQDSAAYFNRSDGSISNSNPPKRASGELPEKKSSSISSSSPSDRAAATPAAQSSYSEIIARAAEKYSLPAALLRAVIKAESGFNPRAYSSAGAIGLMQLMPSTAREVGVDNPWNPEENIEGGARYLRQLLDQYANSVPLALAAYNAGPGQVKKHGGIPPFAETRNYIQRVLKFWSQEE